MEIVIVEDYKFNYLYMVITINIVVPIIQNIANGGMGMVALCNGNRLLICTYGECQIIAITIDLGKIKFYEQTVNRSI